MNDLFQNETVQIGLTIILVAIAWIGIIAWACNKSQQGYQSQKEHGTYHEGKIPDDDSEYE